MASFGKGKENLRKKVESNQTVVNRKKAEVALARQAELIDLSPNAIMVRTFEGVITFWSKGAEKLYGWTKDEAIGQVTHTLFKTKFSVPLEEIEKMQKLEGKWSGELTQTRKDGGKVVVQSYQLCQFVADGKIVEILESNVDITERKKAEEATARQAELIDLSPDAIVVRTFEGVITFWSKGAEKLYGWTKDEALGKVTHRLLKTEFPLPLEEIENKQKLEGKWSGELTHTRKDGGKVVVQSFQLGQFSVNGKIESILESNIDITEHKQQEREVKNLAKFPSENPNPVFRLDGKGTILYGNQAGTSFLTAWKSKVGGRVPKHISRLVADALASDKNVEVEETFGAKTFSILFAPVTLEGYVNIYATDITARKKAEESLKESERLYRKVFDNSQDGFQLIELIYDENGEPYDHKFLRVNRAYEKIIGAKAKDVIGKTARHISPNCESYWFEIPARVAKTGRSEHVELYNKNINKYLDCYYFSYSENAVGTLFRDVTGSKQAQQAIERQASLIDLSPDGIMVKRPDDTVTFWSQGAEKLYGWTKEEAIGRKTRELFMTSFPVSLAEIVGQLKLIGKWSGELIHHAKNGNEVIVQSSWLATFDKQGELTEILESNVDIGERKQAEERVRAASLYSRTLIEASLDPLVTISAEGKITDVNKATEDATGCSREQLIGSDFSNYFTDSEKARKGYRQVFSEGFVIDYPLSLCHKSGKVIDVVYNATVYRNERGEIQGVFAAARDITQQKKAEEQLRAASLYSRSLIEASLDPLVTINVVGKITDVNESTEEVTGCAREELIGSDFSDYFTEPKKAKAGYRRVFTEGYVKDYPLAIRHKSGRITDVLYNASLYRNEAGEIQGVFAAARDITERKAMENEIKETMEKLQLSNAELEQFAYVASHDLQEPLRMVASYVQLLERRYKGKLDPEADEFIAYAVDGANRMRGLIDDLLTYSRVSRLGKPFEPTNLESTLDAALKNLKVSIAENGAVVTHDKLPVVMADGGQLVQLLQNLIGNAIKFHGKELPRVHVSAKSQEKDYLFSVKDNGIGIAPEYYNRLFKIFQRLHTREEYPGLGIGLAVCKRIVERHGGRIWIESQVGKGSTIYFTLNKQKGVIKQNEKD